MAPRGRKPKAAAEGETPEATGASVQVFDKDGAFVRTYSEAIHGKDYAELAEQFAAKIGGTTK